MQRSHKTAPAVPGGKKTKVKLLLQNRPAPQKRRKEKQGHPPPPYSQGEKKKGGAAPSAVNRKTSSALWKERGEKETTRQQVIKEKGKGGLRLLHPRERRKNAFHFPPQWAKKRSL